MKKRLKVVFEIGRDESLGPPMDSFCLLSSVLGDDRGVFVEILFRLMGWSLRGINLYHLGVKQV